MPVWLSVLLIWIGASVLFTAGYCLGAMMATGAKADKMEATK